MTPPLLSVLSKKEPHTSSWSSYRSAKRNTEPSTSYSRSNQPPKTDNLERDVAPKPVSLDALWSALAESMLEGAIIIARNLRPVCTNSKAKDLCQQLLSSDQEDEISLPGVIAEVCHRLLKEGSTDCESLVVEYSGHNGHTIRLRVQWLSLKLENVNLSGCEEPHILVLIEDRHAVLEEELRLDRKKYDLTEREAEIWLLLRQEYTYQEIAEFLQISLNTVKTHVKNVYAKRRSSLGQRKVWYSR